MSNTTLHKFVSIIADDPDPNVVHPSDWNDEHSFNNGSDGQVLTYDSSQTDNAQWHSLPTVDISAPPYNVDMTGVLDASPAFQQAIDDLGSSGGTLIIPAGSVLLDSGLTISQDGIRITGTALQATTLHYDTAGTLFTFSASGSTLSSCELSNLNILSANTTNLKKAIVLEDVLLFTLNNINVASWTGASSVALTLQGASGSTFTNFALTADIPILIDVNPNASIALNEVAFSNSVLNAGNSFVCVTVLDNDVTMYNVVFDGYNTWQGGTSAFTWVDTTGGNGDSIALTFKNIIRVLPTSAPDYAFNFSLSGAAKVLGLIFESCNLSASQNGYYLRQCRNVNWVGGQYQGLAGRTFLDVNNTVYSMSFLGHQTYTGYSVSLSGQVALLALLEETAVNRPVPNVSFFTSTAATVRQLATYATDVFMPALPTSDPGVSGQLWNNSGVLNVSP